MLSRNARTVVNNIVSSQRDVAEAIEFFDQGNLERFAAWGNSRKIAKCSYKVGAGFVDVTNEKGVRFRLERPKKLQPLTDDRFNVIENAGRDFQDGLGRQRRAS